MLQPRATNESRRPSPSQPAAPEATPKSPKLQLKGLPFADQEAALAPPKDAGAGVGGKGKGKPGKVAKPAPEAAPAEAPGGLALRSGGVRSDWATALRDVESAFSLSFCGTRVGAVEDFRASMSEVEIDPAAQLFKDCVIGAVSGAIGSGVDLLLPGSGNSVGSVVQSVIGNLSRPEEVEPIVEKTPYVAGKPTTQFAAQCNAVVLEANTTGAERLRTELGNLATGSWQELQELYDRIMSKPEAVRAKAFNQMALGWLRLHSAVAAGMGKGGKDLDTGGMAAKDEATAGTIDLFVAERAPGQPIALAGARMTRSTKADETVRASLTSETIGTLIKRGSVRVLADFSKYVGISLPGGGGGATVTDGDPCAFTIAASGGANSASTQGTGDLWLARHHLKQDNAPERVVAQLGYLPVRTLIQELSAKSLADLGVSSIDT